MSPLAATLVCFAIYFLGYRFSARRIASRAFQLKDDRPTPAHELADGSDYVPTKPQILFGHHFASIAGLAPMLGPAIAVIWGWVPAMIWVVLGTIFIGAVHDFSALCLSIRAKGRSIGRIAEDIIGHRAKFLFHALIVFLIGLAMGVFVQVVAQLFSKVFYPEAVTPSAIVMIVAIAIGLLSYRHGVSLKILVPIGSALLFVGIWLGGVLPHVGPQHGVLPRRESLVLFGGQGHVLVFRQHPETGAGQIPGVLGLGRRVPEHRRLPAQHLEVLVGRGAETGDVVLLG